MSFVQRQSVAQRRSAVFSIILVAAALQVPRAACAQAKNPFADPQQFFENFFGEESEADREAVQKVEISIKEERRAGETAASAYLEQLKQQGVAVTTRGRDIEYLRKLVELIRPQMKNAGRYKSIKAYLADSDATDARSFPGGTLVFHRGLLEFVESEAALAGVIGHELSHLDRGHQLYHLRRLKMAQQSFASGGDVLAAPLMLMRAFARPFRPEDEAEADEDGATWAYHSGYDPREMATLFARLQERDRDNPLNLAPAFLRTHPYHADRLRAVGALYDELQREHPAADLYIGRKNVERRIPRSEKEFDE